MAAHKRNDYIPLVPATKDEHLTIYLNFIDIVHSLDVPEKDFNPTTACWLTLYQGSLGNSGYGNPTFTFWIGDYKRNERGLRWSHRNDKAYTVAVHKYIFSFICNVQLGKEDLFEVSHLSTRPKQRDISPFNLAPETSSYNQSRKNCNFGCAGLCPHAPKCKFHNLDGLPSPCRNKAQVSGPEQCVHYPNCFEVIQHYLVQWQEMSQNRAEEGKKRKRSESEQEKKDT